MDIGKFVDWLLERSVESLPAAVLLLIVYFIAGSLGVWFAGLLLLTGGLAHLAGDASDKIVIIFAGIGIAISVFVPSALYRIFIAKGSTSLAISVIVAIIFWFLAVLILEISGTDVSYAIHIADTLSVGTYAVLRGGRYPPWYKAKEKGREKGSN